MDQRAFAGLYQYLALHFPGVVSTHFQIMIGAAELVATIGHFQAIVAANVGKAVTGNLQSLVLANGGFLIAANICLFITGYVQALVVTDVFFTVVANGISLVVVDLQLVIFLGPQINELFVFFVLEAEFVVTTTLMGLGAEDRFGSVSRQAIRRHIGGMIGSPGDNRLIRITIRKLTITSRPPRRRGANAEFPAAPAWLTRSPSLLVSF